MRPVLLAVFLLLSACAVPTPQAGNTGRPFLVFFQEWSAAIDDSANATLDAVAQRARAVPAAKVVVTAYADPTGSAEANAEMTRLRARRVSDVLEGLGVAPARIERRPMGAVGFTGTSQESRRVEITIVSP